MAPFGEGEPEHITRAACVMFVSQPTLIQQSRAVQHLRPCINSYKLQITDKAEDERDVSLLVLRSIHTYSLSVFSKYEQSRAELSIQ